MSYINEEASILQTQIITGINKWQDGLYKFESYCPLSFRSYQYAATFSHVVEARHSAFLKASSFLSRSSKLFHSEIADIQNKFLDELDKKINEAQTQNKKLLVVMGESHNTQHSYFLELMISTVLKQYDFQTLLTEYSSSTLGNNMHTTYPYIANKVLNYNIVSIKTKNSNMEHNIALQQDDKVLCHVGVNHLAPILNSQEIRDNFVIFPINLAIRPEHIAYIRHYNIFEYLRVVPEHVYEMHTTYSMEQFSLGQLIDIYKELVPEFLGDSSSNNVSDLFEPNLDKIKANCYLYPDFMDKMASLGKEEL